MNLSTFSASSNAKSFALSCEGFRRVFTDGTKWFVALSNTSAKAAKALGYTPVSILGK